MRSTKFFMKNTKDRTQELKKSEEITMEDRLKYIFGVVSDWLKFAEAKNAALLVAASALVLALFEHFPDQSQTAWLRGFCTTGTSFLLLSVLICLLSFLPKVDFPWLASRRKQNPDDNLFFFGHIADYSAKEYVEALYQAVGLQAQNKKLEIDLAGQVVINARIGMKKYRFFTVAAWIAVLGIGFLAIAGILLLVK